MLLFFGVLLVFTFGYLLSLLIVKEMGLLERLGVSFLLGFGIFTLLMFCYSSFGVEITTESTILALTVCIGLLFILLKLIKRKIFVNPLVLVKRFSDLTRLEKIIVGIIAAIITGSLILSTYFPVYIWDALALYDFRAKVIAQQGFYTQIVSNFSYFTGYPLFTSLSHTLVYLFKGRNPQFLYSFMYVSFIFIFYSILRDFTKRKISLIVTLLLITMPDIFSHSTFAYTNLPYTIFLVVGNIYLFSWFAKNKPLGYLVLAGLFTGLSTWSRVAEPFWLINIFVLIILIFYKFKKYIFPIIIYIISFLLVKGPWNLIRSNQLINSNANKLSAVTADVNSYLAVLSSNLFNKDRIIEVIVYVYKNVITSWYPILPLFLICIVIGFSNFFKKYSTFFLIIIVLHMALLFGGSYIFSFQFSEWVNIPDSARRMSMFFVPLMIFYVGLSFGEKLQKR